jgi:predicted transcriptional regulator
MEALLEPPQAIAPEIPQDGEEATPITIKEKWQGAVTEGSGFVAVPVALLRLQSKYDMTPTDMLVLINLLAHWWDPARAVYPRSTTIAKRMGVDKRTVQRATHKLEKAGLLSRGFTEDGRRIFTFERLVAKLAHDVPAAYVIQAQETHGS